MNESVKEVSDSSFEHEVLESERPVLVDFWAAWCGPCRMLAPTIEAIAVQYSESAAVVKLNVDDNPSTAEAYGIRSIPTLILFSEGKEVERIIGATTKESISRFKPPKPTPNPMGARHGGVLSDIADATMDLVVLR